jgi:hypothetical protein
MDHHKAKPFKAAKSVADAPMREHTTRPFRPTVARRSLV